LSKDPRKEKSAFCGGVPRVKDLGHDEKRSANSKKKTKKAFLGEKTWSLQAKGTSHLAKRECHHKKATNRGATSREALNSWEERKRRLEKRRRHHNL